MPLVEWNASLRLGLREIDEQHAKYIELINRVYDAMMTGDPDNTIGKLIETLIAFAVMHFRTEEKYFDKFDYPDAARHKALHKDCLDALTKFKKDFDAGKQNLTVEVMGFLKDWFIQHLVGEDPKYAALFKAHGMGSA
jgi:hemerythrin-like metal-binding protein